MWKRQLAVGIAAVMLFTEVPLPAHAAEPLADETLTAGQSAGDLVSGGDGVSEDVGVLEGNSAALSETAESYSGTYIPYEQAKYSLSYSVADAKVTIEGITDYTSKEDLGELVIPAEIDGMPVTSIGEQAFRNCSGLT